MVLLKALTAAETWHMGVTCQERLSILTNAETQDVKLDDLCGKLCLSSGAQCPRRMSHTKIKMTV